MARSPKISKTRQIPSTTRQAHVPAEDGEVLYDMAIEHDEELDHNTAEALRIIQEHRKQQAKKTSARSAAFQTKKRAIYAEARKNCRELVKSGTEYLEDAKANLTALKSQEVSREKYFEDYKTLNAAQQGSIDDLRNMYPILLTELGHRRSETVDGASSILKSGAPRRQVALKQFSKDARAQVEKVRQDEKLATDASALIKRYKNLLYNH